MNLTRRIIARLSVALLVLMAGWAVAFYFIITSEINDETDDVLEDYSRHLITRLLAGETLPDHDNGTNNTYHLRQVDAEQAASMPVVSYSDRTQWIASMMDNEPARVLTTVFDDARGRFWELTVAIPSYEKQDLQNRILAWILILYALLLATVLALNAWVVRRSFRPLYALLEWLERVRPGEPVPQIEVESDIMEFSRLSEAMVRSARRSGEIFDEQRIFTGNAAHELQTPVAVCRSRLEMLASDPALSEGQLEQIGGVMGTLDRLAGLNRTLLLLARIDNRGFTDSAPVDAAAILRRAADDYSEVYSHRGITVEVRETAPFRIEMNETLAGVLWGNLLKNAFAHSPQGGRIEVRITGRSVAISNAAAAGPLDPVVIFRRFYRGVSGAAGASGLFGASGPSGAAGESAPGGTGLGLALVESICRLYPLTVAYNFADGRHTFSVTF